MQCIILKGGEWVQASERAFRKKHPNNRHNKNLLSDLPATILSSHYDQPSLGLCRVEAVLQFPINMYTYIYFNIGLLFVADQQQQISRPFHRITALVYQPIGTLEKRKNIGKALFFLFSIVPTRLSYGTSISDLSTGEEILGSGKRQSKRTCSSTLMERRSPSLLLCPHWPYFTLSGSAVNSAAPGWFMLHSTVGSRSNIIGRYQVRATLLSFYWV